MLRLAVGCSTNSSLPASRPYPTGLVSPKRAAMVPRVIEATVLELSAG